MFILYCQIISELLWIAEGCYEVRDAVDFTKNCNNWGWGEGEGVIMLTVIKMLNFSMNTMGITASLVNIIHILHC